MDKPFLTIYETSLDPQTPGIARDGRLSRNLSGSRSRKSRGLGQGSGLRAKGQSGPGEKSAGQSRYLNPAGQ